MRKKLLVIEDEPCIRQVLELHLLAAGYDVICAESAADGLASLSHGGISAVICDFSLPDMDGTQLIKTIKLMNASLPIIVISGFLDDGNADKVMALGVAEFLRKPFPKEALLSAVADVL
jgi:DNA-binding NtrC family response regulator